MHSREIVSKKGFTIVELLIVIVVIGILASITIVAFNGVQARANTTAVTSDLTTFKKKIELQKLQPGTSDLYPTAEPGLISLEMKVSSSSYMTGSSAGINLLYCTSGGGQEYALLAMTKDGKKLYVSSQVASVTEYTGSDNWNGGNYPARCMTALPITGVTNSARSGYSNSDASTPWRTWTGVSS